MVNSGLVGIVIGDQGGELGEPATEGVTGNVDGIVATFFLGVDGFLEGL